MILAEQFVHPPQHPLAKLAHLLCLVKFGEAADQVDGHRE
jgi:hypothetical protein